MTSTLQAVCLILATLQTEPTWEIPGVEVRLDVAADRSIHVTELIQVNYGPNPRRGIDREIPTLLMHPLAGPLELDVRVRRVTHGPQIEVPYTVERGARALVVRIGDPDSTRVGDMIYRLEYDVRGAVVIGAARESLTWPIVGGEWDAGIFQAEAAITLPGEMNASDILVASYTGYFGERDRAADVQMADPRRILVRQTRGLKPYQRLTVDASWPRGAGSVESRADGSTVQPGVGGGWVTRTRLAIIGIATLALYLLLRARRRAADRSAA